MVRDPWRRDSSTNKALLQLYASQLHSLYRIQGAAGGWRGILGACEDDNGGCLRRTRWRHLANLLSVPRCCRPLKRRPIIQDRLFVNPKERFDMLFPAIALFGAAIVTATPLLSPRTLHNTNNLRYGRDLLSIRGSNHHHGGLPACSFRGPEPCACPENTLFQNSTTAVTIGANAKDVAAILDTCELLPRFLVPDGVLG